MADRQHHDATLDYIALLGKRDFPTDGVADYCEWLQAALANRGATLSFYQCRWMELGWWRSLHQLWQDSAQWRGKWVILQYVAFSWSRTGVPLWLLVVLGLLRSRHTRLAVIFHDTQGFPGDRPRDRFRRRLQHGLMRLIYQWTDCSILTIPPEITPWLPQRFHPPKSPFARGTSASDPPKSPFSKGTSASDSPKSPFSKGTSESGSPPFQGGWGGSIAKVVQIPVGSNVPEPSDPSLLRAERSPAQPTVAVFGITGGANGLREINDIAYAVKQALQQVPDLHLLVMGRGSDDAEADIRAAFQDVDLKLTILGLLSQVEVSHHLMQSDVLLFVRGNISSGRTSAVAGVACGVPIVAYRGTHTGVPITEAGVILLNFGDKPALAAALTDLLTDAALWEQLHQRNLRVWREHFAWDTIATRFLEVLPYD